MRRVISAIFLLSVLLFLNFNAHAYPIEFIVEGTIVDSAPNLLGWGGEPFELKIMIDSTKNPNYTHQSTNLIATLYEGDSASLFVNGINESSGIFASEIDLQKFPVTNYEAVRLGAHSLGAWDFNLSMLYNYGYLGDEFPIPVPEGLSIGFDILGSITYPSQDGYPNEYGIEVSSVTSRAVPEPTTMLLFGAGLVGLAGFGRKKFKK